MMGVQDVIRNSLVRRIYNINEKDFDGVALDVWKYQYDFNPLYRSYCDLLGIGSSGIQHVDDIPFLPIVMFREHNVKTGEWEAEAVFHSSGTTGSLQSMHSVRDLNWYHSVAGMCFTPSFGNAGDYTWLGLLPSYLERTDSSLVDMVHYFMLRGQHPESRFFPKVKDDIIQVLEELKGKNCPAILIGVSFALLDLFEQMEVPVWENLLVIETGGMKGRGQEITREELYSRMKQQHHHQGLRIASEYGMTELLSQGYSSGDYFQGGPTLRIRIRDVSDPLRLIDHGQRGVINIIDLANMDTCSFIATDDVGISYADGRFDVLGRLDNSDLRGCNLMYV
jgi:phenylacetate-coenzyme A ligase PaaK-like adenylate-forming protein